MNLESDCLMNIGLKTCPLSNILLVITSSLPYGTLREQEWSQYGSVKNIVGWVEALRNPTNAAKCWVSFL
ncbi:hypothetical protein, partial [Nostoc sp.]|uniref:hypothetical protein n=1 Tax=Nostoc sp. TaxID=1180 RepID=UPI0035943997